MRWLPTLAVLLIAWPAGAASTVAVVTADNLATQPLAFRVESESYADSTLRFEIEVASRERKVSPRREGRFMIWEKAVSFRPGTGWFARGLDVRPACLAAVRAQEDSTANGVHYRVQVHRRLLRQAGFAFLNYQPNGMPAFDGYEIVLGTFAPGEGERHRISGL